MHDFVQCSSIQRNPLTLEHIFHKARYMTKTNTGFQRHFERAHTGHPPYPRVFAQRIAFFLCVCRCESSNNLLPHNGDPFGARTTVVLISHLPLPFFWLYSRCKTEPKHCCYYKLKNTILFGRLHIFWRKHYT